MTLTLSPLAGKPVPRSMLIDVPQLTTGPQLSGNGLAFKALKPAEKGDGVVVRCVNLTGETVSGRWTWPTPLARAQLARLDETPFEEIALENGGTEIPFTVPPRAVMTILATPAR